MRTPSSVILCTVSLLSTLCCSTFAFLPQQKGACRLGPALRTPTPPLKAAPDRGFVPPSLNQVLSTWLVFEAGSRLVEYAPHFMDAGTISSTKTTLGQNPQVNVLVLVGATFNLWISLQNDVYNELEDINKKSLARQAGKWALAGTVPTSYQGKYQVATFAGGCFWGTELHFQRIPGVIATCVGYTQGSIKQPRYWEVCRGFTGHTEGIQLVYDPNVCSYDRLLAQLFSTIDPTLLNQVGNDRGTQYRHGVYFHTKEQAEAAAGFVKRVQDRRFDNKPIVTEVLPATLFWPAENYHQRYLQKLGQSAEKGCKKKVRCYG